MTRRTFLSSLLSALVLGPWLLDFRRKPEPKTSMKDSLVAYWDLSDQELKTTPRWTYTISWVDSNGNEVPAPNLLEDPKCPTSQAW